MRRCSLGTNTWRPSSTTSLPRRTSPTSRCSNPATMRSSVVLPLPDDPRMAVKLPAGMVRSTPSRTWSAPNDLWTPRTASSFIGQLWPLAETSVVERRRRGRAGGRRAGGQPVEPAPQDVARDGGDQDHDPCVGRRRPVAEVRLLGPESRGQRLDTGRDEDEGGRELGRRLEEDEAEGGGQTGPDQGQGDPPEDRGPADPERVPDLLEPDRAPGPRRPARRRPPSGRTSRRRPRSATGSSGTTGPRGSGWSRRRRSTR